LLAGWIRLTSSPEWGERFPGLQDFDDLRLDPYYRAAAARHPDLAPAFDRALRRACECRGALVHGDYSPKHLLVHPGGVMIIDWEVVHYGDPAFDAAFLTNHLLLKAIHRQQDWREYHACAEAFWRALPEWHEGALVHLPCLLLARVDGKSPAEYLTGEAEKEAVRRAAAQILKQAPHQVPDLFPWIFA
jgi:aminoglycoside phosphotransferase (APT) family kinase protein